MKKTSSVLKISLIFSAFFINSCGSDSEDSSSGSGSNNGGQTTGADSCAVFDLARTKISNGEVCSFGSQSSPLVRLSISSLAGNGICTGSIISSNTVLTAAHCLENTVVGITVDTSEGSFEAQDFGVPDEYQSATSNQPAFHDVAIVRISGSFGIPPLPLLFSQNARVGEGAFIGGFGAVTAEGEGTGVARAGEAIIAAVSSNHVTLRFQGDQAHPCFGDSGGPVTVDRGGAPVIAGVVSGSSPGIDFDDICLPGDETLYTNLRDPVVTNFINETGGAFSSQ